jgi:hypothetical protein
MYNYIANGKSLTSSKYKVKNSILGIHEFIPVLFEESNFSCVNLMMHTILLGNSIYFIFRL